MARKGELLQERYRVKACIGAGGNGTVYLVDDLRLDKQWAMKQVLRKQYHKQEAMLLKELKHVGIPQIVDVFEEKENAYMIMEYIEGITMEEWISEHQKASEREAISWLGQLTEILCYLHAHRPGILYLDMKPSNIMVTGEGQLKLLDFGAAMFYLKGEKSVKLGVECYGSPGYAAPEQRNLNRKKIDERSDIYSLGMTMHHLLTGISPRNPPYEKKEITKINPAVSKQLEQIIEKMTSENPVKRFRNCEEVRNQTAKICYKEKLERFKKITIMSGSYGSLFATAILTGVGLERTQVEKWSEYQTYLFASLGLFLICFLLRKLMVQHVRDKYPYTILQNIIVTEKKGIGLWCLLFLCSMAFSYGSVTTITEPRELCLLKDEQQRTVLIKENSIYYTKEPVYIRCGENETSDLYQISIQGGNWIPLEQEGYCLALGQLKKQQTAVAITFRQKKETLNKIYQQTIFVAYG